MVKIVAMNVAGSGAQIMSGQSGPTLSRVRQMVALFAPDLVMLSETHVTSHDFVSSRIVRGFNVVASSSSGGPSRGALLLAKALYR